MTFKKQQNEPKETLAGLGSPKIGCSVYSQQVQDTSEKVIDFEDALREKRRQMLLNNLRQAGFLK